MALVLVVDDSPTEQHVLTQVLEENGFETLVASDGEEAGGERVGVEECFRFSVNNQFGEWWFFVRDPSCDDAVLQTVVHHCR